MNTLINWFAQVLSITWLKLRTLTERRGVVAASAVAAAAAYLAFEGNRASTHNWQSFSAVMSQISVSLPLLVTVVVFAALVGLIGGLFAAERVARLPIAQGLHDG